ncbi:MAG: tetratricopeptide repeat protein [Myxococcales bacterium]|nr:tetratricopeptide repeat protein [Myxococcales bacterium]
MRRMTPLFLVLLLLAGLSACLPTLSKQPRVLLIGLDGVSWDLLQAMMKAGEAPHFNQLREKGAAGTLTGDEPLPPAAFWVSVATGRPPAEHRVTGPIRLDEQTGRLLAPERASSTLWEIAARRRLPAGVIGWPGSAPVPPDVKVAYDDFAFYRGMGLLAELAGEALPVPAHEPDYDSFVGRVPRGGRFSSRLAQASLQEVPALAAKVWPRLQLLAVYLDGLNSARHHAGAALAAGEAAAAPDFGKPSRWYARAVDEALGRLLELADSRTLVLIATDDPSYLAGRTPTGDFAHPGHGIAALYGPNIIPGSTLESPRAADFVPTALAFLGLPQSAQMPGRPFANVWKSPPAQLPKVASLDAFIRRPYAEEGPLHDDGIVRRLQLLQKAADPPRPPFDDRNLYALELLATGKPQGCRSEAQRDLQEHPDNPVGQYLLGETLLVHGRPTEALAQFVAAAGRLGERPAGEPGLAIRVVVGLATAAVEMQLKQASAAAAELDRVLALDPGNAAAVALLAQSHFALDHPANAATLLDRALRKDPEQPALWLMLGQAHERSGNPDAAREAYRTAIRRADKPPVEAYRRLGRLAADRQRWREAIGYLHEALDAVPDDPATWLQLARVYQRREDWSEAEDAVENCLREDRDFVAAWLTWQEIAQANGDEEGRAALLAAARQSAALRLLADRESAAAAD